MVKVKEISEYLNAIAPKQLSESYDNVGLLIGNNEQNVQRILVSLDCTESIVQEAIDKKCQLIVCHHPIIFSGIKKLIGDNYIERTVIMAIKNDISIFVSHTNLDTIFHGVNGKIARNLGLKNLQILSPKSGNLIKLELYCPKTHSNTVREALKSVGAGQIEAYFGCSFSTDGVGRFTGNENSNPFIGKTGIEEVVTEEKIEVIYPSYLSNQVLEGLRKAHPYESIAYQEISILNHHPQIGSGMIGELENEMEPTDFFKILKSKMGASVVKYTESKKSKVKKIAVCGGSGSFLIQTAKNKGADVFVTSDVKYHEFFDADNEIVIADIGHYETESSIKELFFEILKEKFTNIAVDLAETNTNPVKYF